MQFTLATAADDPEIRRLLRENPVPGAFSLAFTREPDYFLGATVEGDLAQSVVARDPGDPRVLGLGGRAVRTAFVNGRPERLGYLGQLRIDTRARGRRGLLAGGFGLIRELHRADGQARFYVTTLIEGNEAARRALTTGRPGLPTYTRRETLCTLALPLRGPLKVRPPAGVTLATAGDADLGAVAGLLQQCYRGYQFAPCWTESDLRHAERVRGLHAGDLRLAWRGQRLVGCAALWDQSGFKQTVVCGYPRWLGRTRPLVNLLGPCLGLPRLPPVGQRLPHAYVSHLAVEGEDPAVMCALLAEVMNASLGRGFAYLTLALAERHPLLGPARRAFRHLEYRAGLYLAHWEDGLDAVHGLDDRVPHLELAVL
jgi:hypothetical protein